MFDWLQDAPLFRLMCSCCIYSQQTFKETVNDVGFGADGPHIKLIFKIKCETHAYGIKNIF